MAGAAGPGVRMRGAVVVVTGASSGIGRATALACAGRGARVVLAARSAAELERVAAQCRERGGEALAVPTDVSDEAAVTALAAAATARFGRIDVWVSAAGAGILGRFDQTPPRDLQRLLEVNVLGSVHAARAAVPVMRRQGGGVLIDVASVLGARLEAAYMGAYSMSKAALATFDEVLRQELILLGDRRIAVCTVLPTGVDTPFFQHAANHTGRSLRSLPPVATPERIARRIVRTARRPRRRVLVGPYARTLAAACALAPGVVRRAAAWHTEHSYLGGGPPPPAPPAALDAPCGPSAAVRGGRHGGPRTAARRTAAAAAVLLAARSALRRRTGGRALRAAGAPHGLAPRIRG
ncbi:SDR family NAD(P)-dependent oxidoreductase [Streptomyces sp. NPDC046866]|uniref:SDR family NAD(P)-dependent oxidoreductase n=1 Tax=Streptomyces sp. NPDC046866 TaxID=3154921 RepID=UPI00345361A7